MAKLGVPVFDADNHMYETREAFTKFLPDRYRSAVEYVELRGRTKIVVKGKLSNYIPNPTFDVVARPGAMEDYYRHGNPDGKDRRAIFGEPMRAIPAFREPAARIQLMDEQGLDRALMFPTLASLLEERMKDDPGDDARRHPCAERVDVRDVAVQLREPHLLDAGHHPPDRRAGDRGARLGRRAGRQGRPHPAGARPWLPGDPGFRAARVRPVLGEGRRARHPRRHALVGQRVRAATRTSGSAATRDAARSSRRRSACSRPGGRSRTRSRR